MPHIQVLPDGFHRKGEGRVTGLIGFLREFVRELRAGAARLEAPEAAQSGVVTREGSATAAAVIAVRVVAGAIESAMKKTLLA